MNRKLQIGVMGPSLGSYPKDKKLAARIDKTAEEIGRLLALEGIIVLTGGCDGVMEAAMRGAKQAGGLTIGFPGPKRGSTNLHCDVEVLTDVDVGSFAFSGMLSSDALITIPYQSAGTLAEVCLAYRHKIPNVALRGFYEMYDKYLIGNFLDKSRKVKLYGSDNAEQAVRLAIKIGKKRFEESK